MDAFDIVWPSILDTLSIDIQKKYLIINNATI